MSNNGNVPKATKLNLLCPHTIVPCCKVVMVGLAIVIHPDRSHAVPDENTGCRKAENKTSNYHGVFYLCSPTHLVEPWHLDIFRLDATRLEVITLPVIFLF